MRMTWALASRETKRKSSVKPENQNIRSLKVTPIAFWS